MKKKVTAIALGVILTLSLTTTAGGPYNISNNLSSKTSETKVTSTKTPATNPSEPQKQNSISRGKPHRFEKYNEKVPMPENEQAYLYKLCKERGLNYIDTLAVIQEESHFNKNMISDTNDYGYFQINIVNVEDLSKTCMTENKPLDPLININWGTYKLSWLKTKYHKEGLSGNALTSAVLSSYHMGTAGYEKRGEATDYIEKYYKSVEIVKSWFTLRT